MCRKVSSRATRAPQNVNTRNSRRLFMCVRSLPVGQRSHNAAYCCGKSILPCAVRTTRDTFSEMLAFQHAQMRGRCTVWRIWLVFGSPIPLLVVAVSKLTSCRFLHSFRELAVKRFRSPLQKTGFMFFWTLFLVVRETKEYTLRRIIICRPTSTRHHPTQVFHVHSKKSQRSTHT